MHSRQNKQLSIPVSPLSVTAADVPAPGSAVPAEPLHWGPTCCHFSLPRATPRFGEAGGIKIFHLELPRIAACQEDALNSRFGSVTHGRVVFLQGIKVVGETHKNTMPLVSIALPGWPLKRGMKECCFKAF